MQKTWTHRKSLAGLASTLVLAVGVAACGDDDDQATAGSGGGSDGGGVKIGLITKTETNPFFVKMKEGAQKKADELGADLQSFAGKKDGDNETQVQAVESLIAAGRREF
jgi:fructose transport system substrate-binding protein